MAKTLNQKVGSLRRKVRSMDSALVALSGGVDSAVLLRICREELGEKAVAVTFLSDDYPSADLMMAKRIARVMGVRHVIVKKDGSCGCSSGKPCSYDGMKKLARKMKLNEVVNGSHRDDSREGSGNLRAARDGGAQSPMLECGLSKEDIRMLARQFGLPNWRKKSSGKRKSAKSSGKAAEMRGFLAGLKLKVSSVSVKGKSLHLSADGRTLKKFSACSDKIRRKMRSLGLARVVLSVKA